MELPLRALSNRSGDDPRRSSDVPQSTEFDRKLN